MLASATITPSAASIAHRPWMSSFSLKRSSENTSLYGASAVSLLTCTGTRWEGKKRDMSAFQPALGGRPLPGSGVCNTTSAPRRFCGPESRFCTSETAEQMRRGCTCDDGALGTALPLQLAARGTGVSAGNTCSMRRRVRASPAAQGSGAGLAPASCLA